jgi:hypothetical protein
MSSRRSNANARPWRHSVRHRILVASSTALLIALAPQAHAVDPAGQVDQVRGEAIAEGQGA